MSDSIETPTRPFESSATWGTTGGADVATPQTEQIIFTRNAFTGDLLNIETIDAAGKRTELPREEALKIAGEDEIGELDAALDAAFEEGVSMVLQETADDDDDATDESRDERLAVVRLLLIPSLGRTTVRRLAKLRENLFHRLLLRRLVRRYLMRQSVAVPKSTGGR
jgi:hypothetical protein